MAIIILLLKKAKKKLSESYSWIVDKGGINKLEKLWKESLHKNKWYIF